MPLANRTIVSTFVISSTYQDERETEDNRNVVAEVRYSVRVGTRVYRALCRNWIVRDIYSSHKHSVSYEI